MKNVWLLLIIFFAGCGAPSNEDIAKGLVKEHLRTTLPDFEHNYEASNFGPLGGAFLPFEETEQYVEFSKTLKGLNDSIVVLEKKQQENGADKTIGNRMQVLKDSITAKGERNSTIKQSYIPEKLFKISHAYIVKDKEGLEKKIEDEFYINKELTKVVKSKNVY